MENKPHKKIPFAVPNSSSSSSAGPAFGRGGAGGRSSALKAASGDGKNTPSWILRNLKPSTTLKQESIQGGSTSDEDSDERLSVSTAKRCPSNGDDAVLPVRMPDKILPCKACTAPMDRAGISPHTSPPNTGA